MLGLELNHVSKRGHMYRRISWELHIAVPVYYIAKQISTRDLCMPRPVKH